MNTRDYSKFLTKAKESPLKNSIVDQKMLNEIEAWQVPQTYNQNANINPKSINRYNSVKRMQLKDGSPVQNKIEKSVQKHNSFINPKPEIGGYLNRRHVQELERLKKFKEERNRKEREEFSFKPKISTKSKTIAKSLVNDNQASYTYCNVNSNMNTNNSRSFLDNSVNANERNENRHRNKSKNDLSSDMSIIKNASACYDKENVFKFKLDIEAKEYVLERMKIIRDNYYNNK